MWRADRRVASVEERQGGERVSRVSVRRVVIVVESQVGVGLERDRIDCGRGVCNCVYWRGDCNCSGVGFCFL